MSALLSVVSFYNAPQAIGVSQGVTHLEKLQIRLSPGEGAFYSEMESEKESSPRAYNIASYLDNRFRHKIGPELWFSTLLRGPAFSGPLDEKEQHRTTFRS